jgi:hypothetical protein
VSKDKREIWLIEGSAANIVKALPLSKFATPHTKKQFIHLDQLEDGACCST